MQCFVIWDPPSNQRQSLCLLKQPQKGTLGKDATWSTDAAVLTFASRIAISRGGLPLMKLPHSLGGVLIAGWGRMIRIIQKDVVA